MIWIPDFSHEAPNSAMLKSGESRMACGCILSIREIRVQRQSVVPQAFQSAGPSLPGLGGRNLVGAVIYLPRWATTPMILPRARSSAELARRR
jgi:hypothetical protein